jgi:hypothetical protein
MFRRVAYLTAVIGLGSLLAGCGFNYFGYERRAAWREQEESACMARRPVMASDYIVQASAIDGNGVCGIDHPLRIAAFQNGAIGVNPTAMLGCPLTEAVESWMRESVQPAAIAWFGLPVTEIKQLSDYSCRTRDNIRGEKLSEHAFGNALDVAAFTLADGRTVTVARGWRGASDEQAFLREVEAAACQRFKTVLGPGAAYHGDHFHLDLAHHNADGTSRYCNPTPQVIPPLRAPYGGDRIAGYPASGQMLANAPADVVNSNLSDPFGVYRSKQPVVAAAPAWRKPFWPPLWGAPLRPPAPLGGLSYAQ